MKFHKLSLKVVSKCNEPRTVPKKNKEEQMAYKTELCNIRRDRLMKTFFKWRSRRKHTRGERLMETFLKWRSRHKHTKPLIYSLHHATDHEEKINKHRSNTFKRRPRD